MTATPAPEDQRESLFMRTKDAIGWAVAYAVSNLTNVGRTWRSASPRERFRLLVAALAVVAGLAIAIGIGAWWSWLLLLWWTVEALADLGDIATAVAERRKTLRLMQTAPTGAPRVAEIQCSRNVIHRFLYGPNGWEEAGPAVHATADA